MKIKDTKLGVIPKDWSTPKIPEVFKFLRNTSFSRNQLNYEEKDGVYCIHYGDIHATYNRPILDFDNNSEIPKINNDVELPSNIDLLKDGDLIIADASEDYEGIGTAIELTNINEKGVLSGLHTFAFRDYKGKTVKGFRTYIFKNPLVKNALKVIATGSKVYGISKGNLENFRIVLPTIAEQQKIAKILETWDNAIATQEQLIVAKELFKKGMTQVLLTGKKRFDGFDGKWEEIFLRDITEVITKGTTPTSLGFSYSKRGINFIKAENISKTGFIDIEKTSKISVECNNALSRSELMKDDIVFSIAGTLGRTAIVKEKDLPANTNQALSIIRLKEDINHEYVNFILNTQKIKKYIHANLSIGAQPNLNLQQVGKLKIKFPSKIEQERITLALSNIDNQIVLLKQQLAQMKGQKQGLIQQLLTGVIRVKI